MTAAADRCLHAWLEPEQGTLRCCDCGALPYAHPSEAEATS